MASLLENLPLELMSRVYALASGCDRRSLLAALPRCELRSTFQTAVRDPGVYWLEAPKLRRPRFPRLSTVTLSVGTQQARPHLRKQGVELVMFASKLCFTCSAEAYWCNRSLQLPGARVSGIRRAYLTQSRAAAGTALALEGLWELHVVIDKDGSRVPPTTARRLTVLGMRSAVRLQAWLPELPGVEQLTLFNVASCFEDATEPLAGLPRLTNMWLSNSDLAGWGPAEMAGLLRAREVSLVITGAFPPAEMEEWGAVLGGIGSRFVGTVDPEAGHIDGNILFWSDTTDAA